MIPQSLKSHAIPYVDLSTQDSDLQVFLNNLMAGYMSSKWTRKSRLLRHVFSRKVLIKFVRGNLLAAYLSDHYKCKCIFILRHPCGVAASVLRKRKDRSHSRGIERGLGSADLIRSLLDQAALNQAYLSPFLPKIGKWTKDPFYRIVLAWAITNFIPLKQIKDGMFNPELILYERFVLKGASSTSLSQFLDIDHMETGDGSYLQKDSISVRPERKGIPPAQRVFSWKKELTEEQIREVYEICSVFGSVLMDKIKEIDAIGEIADGLVIPQ